MDLSNFYKTATKDKSPITAQSLLFSDQHNEIFKCTAEVYYNRYNKVHILDISNSNETCPICQCIQTETKLLKEFYLLSIYSISKSFSEHTILEVGTLVILILSSFCQKDINYWIENISPQDIKYHFEINICTSLKTGLDTDCIKIILNIIRECNGNQFNLKDYKDIHRILSSHSLAEFSHDCNSFNTYLSEMNNSRINIPQFFNSSSSYDHNDQNLILKYTKRFDIINDIIWNQHSGITPEERNIYDS